MEAGQRHRAGVRERERRAAAFDGLHVSVMRVRIGATHYIRAIRDVTKEGHLVFACAIDQGMVLNLLDEKPTVADLEEYLAAISTPETPVMILGFECLFRRMAFAQSGCTQQISRLLQRNKLVGFSTYGEQYNRLHVNQTLVGVAFYPAKL